MHHLRRTLLVMRLTTLCPTVIRSQFRLNYYFHGKAAHVGPISSYSLSDVGEPVLGLGGAERLIGAGGEVWTGGGLFGLRGNGEKTEYLPSGMAIGKTWDA